MAFGPPPSRGRRSSPRLEWVNIFARWYYTLSWPPEGLASNPERSSVNVTIQAASVDTSERDRDTHLRTGDFFDVEKFPTLTFNSTRVTRKSNDSFDVTGDLTIHGVTRPVTLAATFLGKAKDPWGNERTAFEAETTINRKDFGLLWNAALETGGFLVGDEVKISLSVQALPKAS